MPEPSASSHGDDEILAGFGHLTSGRRLGPYELLAPIGRGGMAVVWAAQDGDRLVAVKTLIPALSADPRFEKMFLAEAKVASAIEHENVCRVLGHGESEGQLYLAMEWHEGDSLAALLEAHAAPLACPVAVRIVLDAARGLVAAHAATDAEGKLLGIVHRDVSPQNVLVGVDGTSRIADFGIAKVEGERTTQAGYTKGKIRYMAPEQVYCERVDVRTDVFALGVVMYEATTGRHPFEAATDMGILAKIAAPDTAPLPSSEVDDYPAAVETLVMRAIAKDMAERFATMDELVAALEALDVAPASAAEVADALTAARADAIAERRRKIADARTRVGDAQPVVTTARAKPRSAATLFAVGAALGLAAAGAVTALSRGEQRTDEGGDQLPAAAPTASAASVVRPSLDALPVRDPETTAVPAAGADASEASSVAARDRSRAARPKSKPAPASADRPIATVPAPSGSIKKSGVLETRE